MLLPWAAGFVTYQLINPGYVSWWASAWTSIGHAIGFTPASWMSASILSFAVAAVLTWRFSCWPAQRPPYSSSVTCSPQSDSGRSSDGPSVMVRWVMK